MPDDETFGGSTPALRLFSLLELIVRQDHLVTLQELVTETGMAKPTVHRMLQQLEEGGLVVRQSGGRHYAPAARTRLFAESLLLNAVQHGARHQVLRHLVARIGETCNVTALANGQVIYVDRVETDEPLRFQLHPGSRVPVHCSASGKMILSQLPPRHRDQLLSAAPLERFTAQTTTEVDQLLQELDQVRAQGWAVDDEEYLEGLFCVAVPVPSSLGTSTMCVAVQAPVVRLHADNLETVLPAVREAATAIASIEQEGSA